MPRRSRGSQRSESSTNDSNSNNNNDNNNNNQNNINNNNNDDDDDNSEQDLDAQISNQSSSSFRIINSNSFSSFSSHFSQRSKYSNSRSIASNNLEIELPQNLLKSNKELLNNNNNRITEELDENSQNTDFIPQNVIWGTNIVSEKCRKIFADFINSYTLACLPDQITGSGSTSGALDIPEAYYLQKLEELHLIGESYINLDCMHLKSFNSDLYKQLINYPREIIPIFDLVINEIYRDRYSDDQMSDQIQIRPFNPGDESCRSLRLLEPVDLDKVISVPGMVTRVSNIIPELRTAYYECEKCFDFELVDMTIGNRFEEPSLCKNCQNLNLFKLIHNKSLFSDRQIVKLQEDPNCIPHGETPHSLLLTLHDDLVDRMQSGDRILVTGIFKASSTRANSNSRFNQNQIRSIYRTFIDVLHFSKSNLINNQNSALNNFNNNDNNNSNINNNNNNNDYNNALNFDQNFANNYDESDENNLKFSDSDLERIKEISRLPNVVDLLSESIAPEVFGLHDVKKGLLLQLLGGTEKLHNSNSSSSNNDNAEISEEVSLRSEINILLCGDPGTSKSQLLKFIYEFLPRSQYTSGKSSSAVGLTAYLTKDPETRTFVLQSGALALADRAICCIDEFDKMSDYVRSVLHEVMEQQSMSIAKAGIICELKARVAILAAANPVDSHWNSRKTIVENLQLPSTLLSRFDLIFLVLDPQSEEYDKNLASHLVSLFSINNNNEENDNNGILQQQRRDRITNMDLRKYIAYAKANIKPKLSDEASSALIDAYVEMRQLSSTNSNSSNYRNNLSSSSSLSSNVGQINAYPRQLESLIRLSEALSKCKLSQIVTKVEVEEALDLYREALRQSATDPNTGKIDVSILTTGLSSYKRKIHREIANSIRQIIDSLSKSRLPLSDIYENLSANSDVLIKRNDFDNAIRILESEGYIKCAPNGELRVVLNSI